MNRNTLGSTKTHWGSLQCVLVITVIIVVVSGGTGAVQCVTWRYVGHCTRQSQAGRWLSRLEQLYTPHHSSSHTPHHHLSTSSVQKPSVLWRCWVGGRKGIWPVKTDWCGAGVVICLERGADLHTAQLMPLPLVSLASVKSRLVLPLSYWLAQVVPDKEPLNSCVCLWS